MSTVSVIMPVLNEARGLRETLRALSTQRGCHELVIADGGSTDETLSIAREFTSRVITCPRGRARQMNTAAAAASGDILLFLHADCVLPAGAFELIIAAMSNEQAVAGAFDLGINHPALWARVIENAANIRSRLSGVPYGDQALFVRRSVFERIGGFADLPLMEDVEIAGRLKREGRIVFINQKLSASPRRWLAEGPLHTTLRDWYIALRFTLFKTSAEELVRLYRDVR